MKINVLINPKCAGTDQIARMIGIYFPDSKIKTSHSSPLPNSREDFDTGSWRAADLVIAAGGDGTVNEAINIVAGSETPLGIIPCGTANDLASLYKMPSDLKEACKTFRKLKQARIDLISINGRYYATAGGLGFASRVVEIANSIKRRYRAKRVFKKGFRNNIYVIASLAALHDPAYLYNPIEIAVNGKFERLNAFSVFINNQRFLGRNIKITPDACNRDRYFDVCIIRNPLNRLKVISLLYKTIKATHVELPYVKFIRSSTLRIRSKSRLKYFGDGEILDEGSEFDVKLVPGALNLVVPFKNSEN